MNQLDISRLKHSQESVTLKNQTINPIFKIKNSIALSNQLTVKQLDSWLTHISLLHQDYVHKSNILGYFDKYSSNRQDRTRLEIALSIFPQKEGKIKKNDLIEFFCKQEMDLEHIKNEKKDCYFNFFSKDNRIDMESIREGLKRLGIQLDKFQIELMIEYCGRNKKYLDKYDFFQILNS